ncbi:helix-turn-helix domain-containing protein [Funiculus sociatus]|uniref:helix-turn-helix domain-containing protein n=1 Tax=Funiculus sociatus TaxID=450527 RepID=UPI0032974D56
MHFTRLQTWQYQVRLDPTTGAGSDTDLSCAEYDLQLTQALHRVQPQPPLSQSEWLTTAQAAEVLGLSPEQLRRLRRKGLFKVGHHCRDTSVPGSGLSRWQWHLIRCGKALEVPPEKRAIPSK